MSNALCQLKHIKSIHRREVLVIVIKHGFKNKKKLLELGFHSDITHTQCLGKRDHPCEMNVCR